MIYLNGKTEKDYACDYIHWEITSPVPKMETAEIPLRDGYINLTAMLSDEIFYQPRTITIGLELRAMRSEWAMYHSQILRDLHGKEITVSRTEDPNWFWLGWASVSALDDHGSTAGITITVTAQPYKRTEQYAEIADVVLSGDTSYTIDNPYMRGYPEFEASAAGMTVTYQGETWTLGQGKSEAYGLYLTAGENVLELSGSGTLRISYRGGRL